MTAIGLSDLYFSRHFFPPAVPHLVAHSVVPSIRSDFLSNGAQNACDASCNARLERLFVEGIGMLWAHLRPCGVRNESSPPGAKCRAVKSSPANSMSTLRAEGDAQRRSQRSIYSAIEYLRRWVVRFMPSS